MKFGGKMEICVGKVRNFEEKKMEIWGKIKTWKNCKFGKCGNLEKFGNLKKFEIWKYGCVSFARDGFALMFLPH